MERRRRVDARLHPRGAEDQPQQRDGEQRQAGHIQAAVGAHRLGHVPPGDGQPQRGDDRHDEKACAPTDGMRQRSTECGQRGGDGVSHAEVGRDRCGPSTRREHRVGDRQRQADQERQCHPDTGAGDHQHRGCRRGGGQRAESDGAGQPDQVHASHAVEVAQRAGAEHCGRHGQSRQAGDERGGASRDVQAARDDLQVGREDRRVADGNGIAEAHGDYRHRGRQARDVLMLAFGASIRRHARMLRPRLSRVLRL